MKENIDYAVTEELTDEEKELFHPISNLYPLMTGDSFKALADDIRENGLQQPILLYGKKVLDGRNRFRACKVAGVLPIFEIWDERGSALELVTSLNLFRRHLNESQRSLVASAITTYKNGGDRRSNQSANSQNEEKITTAQAADLLSVSIRSINVANKVCRSASQALINKVKQGRLSLNAVETLTQLNLYEQDAIAKNDEDTILRISTELRKKRFIASRKNKLLEITSDPEDLTELGDRKKFNLLLCDPPWPGPGSDKRIPYPLMTIQDICDLDVQSISSANSICFMYTTNYHLRDSFEVLKAWGFKFCSQIIWCKQDYEGRFDNAGVGSYFINTFEPIIIGVRGNVPSPEFGKRLGSIIYEQKSPTHSEKPASVPDALNFMFPELSKIELFSRRNIPGFYSWGNQVGVLDLLDKKKKSA
jgi:N6-adenosine-specific RNA methylase IME4